MEVKFGTSVFHSFNVVKEAVGRVDNVLQLVEETLELAFSSENTDTQKELVQNAILLLQDARKQLK